MDVRGTGEDVRDDMVGGAVRGGGVRLLTPRRQRADGPLVVRVTGLPVDARVVLRLSARSRSGSWVSSDATFATVDGVLDVGRDAPTSGYGGVDADGLLRGLPPAPQRRIAPGRDPFAPELLTVGVRREEAEVATATIERHVLTPSVTVRRLEVARGVQGWLFDPGVGAHGVAVVGVPTATRAPVERAAALLASHGYPVFLLPRHPTVAGPADRDMAAVDTAGRWLLEQVGADPARLAVVDLDVVPDRASREATAAWEALLDRLRRRTVAPNGHADGPASR